MTNRIGSVAKRVRRKIASASSEKAIVIVSSRPMRSEMYPHIGRMNPFTVRSRDAANVAAGNAIQRKVIGTFDTPNSMAMGTSAAVAMRPPVATRTIIRYRTQKLEDAAISCGLTSRPVCRLRSSSACASLVQVRGSHPCGGALRKSAAMMTTTPWMIPHWMNVA